MLAFFAVTVIVGLGAAIYLLLRGCGRASVTVEARRFGSEDFH